MFLEFVKKMLMKWNVSIVGETFKKRKKKHNRTRDIVSLFPSIFRSLLGRLLYISLKGCQQYQLILTRFFPHMWLIYFGLSKKYEKPPTQIDKENFYRKDSNDDCKCWIYVVIARLRISLSHMSWDLSNFLGNKEMCMRPVELEWFICIHVAAYVYVHGISFVCILLPNTFNQKDTHTFIRPYVCMWF